ncbi:MAG: hypothetical protein WDN49_10115 [Acetobacteraceae bacterium]
MRADAVPAFAAYLATVAAAFPARDEGIAFASVSPLNEPDGTWWGARQRPGGQLRQPGHAGGGGHSAGPRPGRRRRGVRDGSEQPRCHDAIPGADERRVRSRRSAK